MGPPDKTVCEAILNEIMAKVKNVDENVPAAVDEKLLANMNKCRTLLTKIISDVKKGLPGNAIVLHELATLFLQSRLSDEDQGKRILQCLQRLGEVFFRLFDKASRGWDTNLRPLGDTSRNVYDRVAKDGKRSSDFCPFGQVCIKEYSRSGQCDPRKTPVVTIGRVPLDTYIERRDLFVELADAAPGREEDELRDQILEGLQVRTSADSLRALHEFHLYVTEAAGLVKRLMQIFGELENGAIADNHALKMLPEHLHALRLLSMIPDDSCWQRKGSNTQSLWSMIMLKRVVDASMGRKDDTRFTRDRTRDGDETVAWKVVTEALVFPISTLYVTAEKAFLKHQPPEVVEQCKCRDHQNQASDVKCNKCRVKLTNFLKKKVGISNTTVSRTCDVGFGQPSAKRQKTQGAQPQALALEFKEDTARAALTASADALERCQAICSTLATGEGTVAQGAALELGTLFSGEKVSSIELLQEINGYIGSFNRMIELADKEKVALEGMCKVVKTTTAAIMNHDHGSKHAAALRADAITTVMMDKNPTFKKEDISAKSLKYMQNNTVEAALDRVTAILEVLEELHTVLGKYSAHLELRGTTTTPVQVLDLLHKPLPAGDGEEPFTCRHYLKKWNDGDVLPANCDLKLVLNTLKKHVNKFRTQINEFHKAAMRQICVAMWIGIDLSGALTNSESLPFGQKETASFGKRVVLLLLAAAKRYGHLGDTDEYAFSLKRVDDNLHHIYVNHDALSDMVCKCWECFRLLHYIALDALHVHKGTERTDEHRLCNGNIVLINDTGATLHNGDFKVFDTKPLDEIETIVANSYPPRAHFEVDDCVRASAECLLMMARTTPGIWGGSKGVRTMSQKVLTTQQAKVFNKVLDDTATEKLIKRTSMGPLYLRHFGDVV